MFLLPLSVACVNVGTLQRARTLDAGRSEAGIDVGVNARMGTLAQDDPRVGETVTSCDDGDCSSHTYTAGERVVEDASFPVNYLYRRGLREGAEMGLRVGMSGAEGSVKVRVTDADQRWTVALAPALGVSVAPGLEDGARVYGQLPVLVDLPVGESAWVLAPKAVVLGGTPAGTVWGLGGSLGFAWDLFGYATLLPEYTYVRVVGDGTGRIDQLSLALTFHARRSTASSP